MEQVDDIMFDIQESMAVTNEIGEALAQGIGGEVRGLTLCPGAGVFVWMCAPGVSRTRDARAYRPGMLADTRVCPCAVRSLHDTRRLLEKSEL